MSLSEEATYYRTALLLGLVRGDRVHRWADEAIAREATPHGALIEVASAPVDDLSAMRDALWPLVIEPDPPAVLRQILVLIHTDLAAGRRSEHDTLTVLRQLRSMVKLPRPLYDDLSAMLVARLHADETGAEHGRTALLAWLTASGVD